MKLIIKLRSDR